MSAWTNGTYTHKGLALLAKLTQGASLEITRAVAGTGYVSEANLARQTAVTGAKQTLYFKAVSYPETGVCKLPMFLTNDNVAAAYTAKQIGVYAKDPDEGEILYFICQSQNGTNVPARTDMPDYSATWTFYFRYGQADNVAVTVDPSHTITQDMLDEVRVIAEAGSTTVKQGDIVVFDNSAELPPSALKLFGKTTQVTTKGINLLNTNNTGTFLNNQGSEKTGVIVPITTTGVYRYYIYDIVTVYVGYADSLTANATHVESCLGGTTAASGTISLRAGQYFLLWFDTGITVKDSTNYFLALGANAAIEPYTGGKPAPSPDYPQELVSAGDGGSIDVLAPGKNLLGLTTLTNVKKNFVQVGVYDNEISLQANEQGNGYQQWYGTMDIPASWRGRTFTFSVQSNVNEALGTTTPKVFLIENDAAGNELGIVVNLTFTANGYHESGRFTVRENTSSFTFLFRVDQDQAFPVGKNMWFGKIQLELGDSATAFEPYKAKTLAVPTPNGLPGIPVSSGGNYTDASGQRWVCDEIDLIRGVHVQRINQITLDGDEVWAKSGEHSYYVRVQDGKRVQPICDRLGVKTDDNSPYIKDGTTGDGVNAIIVSFGSEVTTVDEFKAALAQKPLNVQYALATPVETALSVETLNAYADLIMQHNHTTVYNDAGAWMEAGCVVEKHEGGFQMLLQQIDVLKATIASLQSAMETELMS